jgi:hypothetical protein
MFNHPLKGMYSVNGPWNVPSWFLIHVPSERWYVSARLHDFASLNTANGTLGRESLKFEHEY